MWLSQNEIQTLLKNNKREDNRVDFRLFAPNNASILTNVIKADSNIKVSDYYNLMSMCAFQNYKKQENKENVSTVLTLTQHFDDLEKSLRKQATEFDKINNKYIFDPSKIDYLGNSYDYYRQQKWKAMLGPNGQLFNSQVTPLNNWVVDEIWRILDTMRTKELVFENLKLNYYNPKKQYYVSEAETKKIEKTGKYHYLKYKISKDNVFKITNVILDQVDESLKKHITYQNDLVGRIKVLTERKPKKSSIAQILGLTKVEYEDFNNSFKLADQESQKNLEYLQGHLLVVEQNIATLKKIKGVLLHQYEMSFLVGFENLWHSLFTMAIVIKKDIEYSLYYLSKSKELVIVPEQDAVSILGLLLEENVINSPDLKSKMSQFKDSSEFFDFMKAGIQKIASLKGDELEGISIDMIGDIDIDSIEYSARSNIGRVILDQDGVAQQNITPIHQFNQKTFSFLNTLNFPIMSKLSNQGKLINMGAKFSSLENYIAAYSENYLSEIYEREGDYFIAKNGVKFEKIYSSDDSVTELYPLPEKNWFINFPNPCSLAGRNEWAMPLPVFNNANKSFWLSSFEDIAVKAINPIFRVVLGKNLKYEFFESSKAVLMSDSVSKIPLGLSTTQYRSKNLTELRKERRLEWSVFCAYADKIYEEILQLFEKYEVVQIQFTNEESVKFQNWFYGKEEEYQSNSNSVLYFYNKVQFHEDGTVSNDKTYNYLNPQKNTLSDIFVKDEYDNIYSYSNLTLDYLQEEKMLDLIALKNAYEENTNVYYQSSQKHHIEDLKSNFEFVFGKNKTLTSIQLETIEQKDSIDRYFKQYESDIVRLALFMNSGLIDTEIEILQGQEYLLAENLLKFFNHRSPINDGPKDDIVLWVASYTNDFNEALNKLTKEWKVKEIYSLIYNYIDVLNKLVFPILRQIPMNDKGQAQEDVVQILNNFVYTIKPFLPFYSEKIYQVIYQEKNTNSLENPINLFTLKTASGAIKDKINNIIQLKDEVLKIRLKYNIPEYQGLYADFSYLNADQKYIKYLQVFLNLVPKSLMNVEGQIEKILFQNNPIIIDLVLDSSLKSIAAQKELSKIILNWKTKNNIKLKQVVKLQIRHSEFEDNKILSKLKINSYWPDIYAETIWEDRGVDSSEEEVYNLLDIANIRVKNITN
jgi:valyl-tRNA synthetase